MHRLSCNFRRSLSSWQGHPVTNHPRCWNMQGIIEDLGSRSSHFPIKGEDNGLLLLLLFIITTISFFFFFFLFYLFADLTRFTHTLPSRCSSPSSLLLPLSSALSLLLLSTTPTGPVNSSRDRPQALLSTTATTTADKLLLDPASPTTAAAQLSSTTTPTASNAPAQITTTSGTTTAAL